MQIALFPDSNITKFPRKLNCIICAPALNDFQHFHFLHYAKIQLSLGWNNMVLQWPRWEFIAMQGALYTAFERAHVTEITTEMNNRLPGDQG